MALLRRDEAVRCQGSTNACCIIIPTRTRCRTQTHTRAQRQAAAETRLGQKGGTKRKKRKGEQTGARGRRMSHFADRDVASTCRRIQNVPLLELLAVSPGPYVPPPVVPPSLPALHASWRYLGQEAGCLELEVGLTGS